MKSETPPSANCFKFGRTLLNAEFDVEDETEILTDKLLAEGELGRRIPETYEELGTALSLFLQIASCQWGCRGGQHREENLIRRLSNYAFAAIRLARLGLYDEAVSMLRCIAELVNLIELFTVKKELLDRWYTVTPKKRRDCFGPAEVRKKIEGTRNRPVVDKSIYAALCELGVHVTPDSAHLSHDFQGKVSRPENINGPAR